VHKLLAYQLRNVTRTDGAVDAKALIAVVERTYSEFDRERRLNDRAAKLMEEELQAANEQIRKKGERRLVEALEGAPCAIALLNPDAVIENINSAMLALCADLVIAPEPGDLFVDMLASIAPDADVKTLVQRLLEYQTVELQIEGRWYLGNARGLSDGCHAVAFSDVTALKEREAALALARDAAESANRMKSQFLATMSHELRTPLNAILGFSEIIRDRVMGMNEKALEQYCEYSALIHKSGEHLLGLISEVLDLSKIESGAYTLEVETVDLWRIVRDSLNLVRSQAERGRIKLEVPEPTGDLSIEADPRAVKQVVVNLLSNAVKFTPPGGRVMLTADPASDRVSICVQDTGIGIAQEHLKAVFEAFHQGDAKVARRYEGTGLGLSITKRLVEIHGGSIALASVLGQGTQATITFPRQAKIQAGKKAAA
jgi:signal transduction histidine kinase